MDSAQRTRPQASTIAPRREVSQSILIWLVRLLALVALGVCGYLFYKTVALSELPAGCGAGSDCEQVLSSKWSLWFSIPVSVPAAAVYFVIFVAAVLIDPVFEPVTRRAGWRLLVFLATLAAGSAIWFIIVQKTRIGRFCPWCLSVHACGLLIAILVLLARRGDAAVQGVAARKSARPAIVWPFALLSLLFVGALIFGQAAPAKNSVISRSDLAVPFDWHDFPLLGSPDAPHVILIMGDYTCPHCQRTHPSFEAVRKRYGNQIAMAVAIVPMNSNCNRAISQTSPVAKNACELARIALAVWRAKPQAFDEMDRWLFEEATPPSPDQARAHAAALVGERELKAAEADPWINQTIQHGVDLYLKAGVGPIPKTFITGAPLTGEIDEPSALFQVIEKELGVKPVS